MKRRVQFHHQSTHKNQRGVVMVMTAIALVALIGATGMALDGGHILLTKTRLQNAVDSAALSGAKTLNLTEDYLAAKTAAREVFTLNASQGKEMLEAYNIDNSRLIIEFSETLTDAGFQPVPSPGSEIRFIRVSFSDLELDAWLIQVTGFDNKRVSASAVSGPTPPLIKNLCGVAPVLLCEKDPLDQELFGYVKGETSVLKYAADDPHEIGVGNFHLLRLDSGPGAKNVMINAAGGYEDTCLSTENTVPTEPGNEPTSVAYGFNTRFGLYEGPLKNDAEIFPADFKTTEPGPYLAYNSDTQSIVHNDGTAYTGSPSYDATQYLSEIEAHVNADANDSLTENSPEYRRRVLTVPVGQCDGSTTGSGDVLVKGFLCMFLIQHVATPQNPIPLVASSMGIENYVFSEVINSCNANGTFSDTPTYSASPVNIVLHNDPGRTDS